MTINHENYVDEAEKVIKSLSTDKKGNLLLTTSKIRNILSMINDIYNDTLHYKEDKIDNELKEHTEAIYIDMKKVANVSYEPKYKQLCFEYQKGSGDFGEILNIDGTSSKTLYGPKNIHQPEEIEKFLDFVEAFRSTLEEKGLKLDKWKR